jgi:fructose-bisphosphate aldolase class II
MADPIQYEKIGLVNTKEMFIRAMEGKYAVPAYNFSNMEQLQAIVTGCAQSDSPVILQVSGSARRYADPVMIPHMVEGAVAMVRKMGSNIPMALHLDHGNSFELAKDCIDSGFSSVMIDGSHHSFGENIRLTAEVVAYAHTKGVTVEGELGVLAGVEDEVASEVSHYTQPDEVEAFVSKTGVDSLAISIGTSHGAHKFKLKPGEKPPTLRFDILEEIESRLPGYPIVLHGASSVSPEHVAMINQFGGNLESAVGIPAEQLRRAAQSAVCKINIDSDGRLAVTAVIRKIFSRKAFRIRSTQVSRTGTS